MKRPQPDIGDILRASFISSVKTTKKLKRLWGTTTVGGVEVLKQRQYYYPTSSRSADFEKLFKFLGSYEAVTDSEPKGVESAWVYFNKNQNTTLVGDFDDFVASNLNQLWWDSADGVMPSGLTLTTNIVIEAETTSRANEAVRTTDLLDPSWTKAQLMQAVEDNYESLWDTCLISQQGVGVINKGSSINPIDNTTVQDEDDLSPNDPWLEAISRYALRDNGIPCTIKDVTIGIGTEGPRLYSTYVVTIEIPYNFFNTGALFVESITYDLESSYSSRLYTRLSYANGYWTQKAIKAMDSSDLEDGTTVTRPYRLWENEATETSAVYSALWYNYNGTWYLRAAPFTNPRAHNLTYKQLSSYVLQLIDSGYKKKTAPWWKKLIAIIVFILIVWFSQGTGTDKAVVLAQAIVGASLVLNIITIVLSAAGMDEWALAFAEASKTIEPLVQIATLITMMNSFSNFMDNIGDELEDQTLGEAVKKVVSEELDTLIAKVTEGATDLFAGKMTDLSLQFSTRLVQLLTLPTKLKIASINERNKDLQSEYEGLLKEMYQESDALRGFARIYAKPATADWSMYAGTYDLPYERGGGILALGNIQRTTKQALRKAKYNDPVFENILIL